MVDVTLKGHAGNQRLTVTLDGDKGVQIDQCVEVSRKLGSQLEEMNLIDGKYTLEVTSAGLGEPLKMVRQYQKNIGRNLEVRLIEGGDISGKLVEVNEDGIVLEAKDEKRELNFKEIDKSTVAVSFK